MIKENSLRKERITFHEGNWREEERDNGQLKYPTVEENKSKEIEREIEEGKGSMIGWGSVWKMMKENKNIEEEEKERKKKADEGRNYREKMETKGKKRK